MIYAGFPHKLWPKLVYTATFLITRSLRARTADPTMRTPYEITTGYKPNVAYVYQFGARAYLVIYSTEVDPDPLTLRKRKAILLGIIKVTSRTYIGYLCGYKGYSIYRI